MKNSYWVALAVAALVVGVLIGYGLWGSRAARLPAMEQQLSTTQAQMEKSRKEITDLKANLGDVTNQKLNLEKEVAELKEALEKATKRGRPAPAKK